MSVFTFNLQKIKFDGPWKLEIDFQFKTILDLHAGKIQLQLSLTAANQQPLKIIGKKHVCK